MNIENSCRNGNTAFNFVIMCDFFFYLAAVFITPADFNVALLIRKKSDQMQVGRNP